MWTKQSHAISQSWHQQQHHHHHHNGYHPHLLTNIDPASSLADSTSLQQGCGINPPVHPRPHLASSGSQCSHSNSLCCTNSHKAQLPWLLPPLQHRKNPFTQQWLLPLWPRPTAKTSQVVQGSSCFVSCILTNGRPPSRLLCSPLRHS